MEAQVVNCDVGAGSLTVTAINCMLQLCVPFFGDKVLLVQVLLRVL